MKQGFFLLLYKKGRKKWMSGGKKMQLEYATELRRRIWSSKLSKLHGTHSTR